MKMKFFGMPNELVKTRKKVWYQEQVTFKPLFRFDDNGEFITDDENLIKKLVKRFDHAPVVESVDNESMDTVDTAEIPKVTRRKGK